MRVKQISNVIPCHSGFFFFFFAQAKELGIISTGMVMLLFMNVNANQIQI